MARKGKAYVRHMPVIYPDSVRPPPALPDAASVVEMGFELSEQELTIVRMAMAIHTTSKQPKLTWIGWRHIAVALAIGSDHALKTSGGRTDTPLYIRTMSEFLRKTGFTFLNKDDRACAVRLLPHWNKIDEWRASLSPNRQQHLNNPREVWDAYLKDRRGDPEATRKHPTGRHHRSYPSLLEQVLALAEQLEMAEERAERAERESTYFTELMLAVAERANLDDDAIAEIRAKIRSAHEAEVVEVADDAPRARDAEPDFT